ncbi:histidine triad protein [Mycoplasma mycoides subsp. mycoides]|nr:histidine triad protein [Mycoplasma mycoides subsp. mycoides]
MDCLFCKIINQEIPSYKIYENEYVYSFLDVRPVSNGHLLIIPKKSFWKL